LEGFKDDPRPKKSIVKEAVKAVVSLRVVTPVESSEGLLKPATIDGKD